MLHVFFHFSTLTQCTLNASYLTTHKTTMLHGVQQHPTISEMKNGETVLVCAINVSAIDSTKDNDVM